MNWCIASQALPPFTATPTNRRAMPRTYDRRPPADVMCVTIRSHLGPTLRGRPTAITDHVALRLPPITPIEWIPVLWRDEEPVFDDAGLERTHLGHRAPMSKIGLRNRNPLRQKFFSLFAHPTPASADSFDPKSPENASRTHAFLQNRDYSLQPTDSTYATQRDLLSSRTTHRRQNMRGAVRFQKRCDRPSRKRWSDWSVAPTSDW